MLLDSVMSPKYNQVMGTESQRKKTVSFVGRRKRSRGSSSDCAFCPLLGKEVLHAGGGTCEKKLPDSLPGVWSFMWMEGNTMLIHVR